MWPDPRVEELEFGVARIAFSNGEFEKAETRFRHIMDSHPESEVAPEALYWAGVSRYKGADDADALKQTAAAMRQKYPESPWQEGVRLGEQLNEPHPPSGSAGGW